MVIGSSFVTTQTTTRATLEDLYRVEGKAELIRGRIVEIMRSGDLPTEVTANIYVSLRAFAKSTGRGVAKTDGTTFAVDELPSGRESFAPDAAYHLGPRPVNRMKYFKGAPTFAVEARSEFDYGRAAEIEMEEKREDYFAAGTLVVWDVDPKAETIAVFRPDAPTTPVVFRRSEIADAEPAVPGWRMAVDQVFAG